MTSPSQPSDKLKSILGRRGAAAAARPAQSQPRARVDDLLDRGGDLPDARALARMYKDRDLANRLPEDESDSPTASTSTGSGGDDQGAHRSAVLPVGTLPTPDRTAEVVGRAPMSPAEIRGVMQELSKTFGSTGYTVIERKLNAPEPLVVDRDLVENDGAVPAGGEWIYAVGAALALVVVIAFVYLALYGPAPFHPAPVVSPSATSGTSASAKPH